jgi:hypothetical protein
MRRPFAKVGHETLLALGFRAQLQNALFPKKIKGKFVGNQIGELQIVRAVMVTRVIAEDQSVTSLIELNEPAAKRGINRSGTVFQIVHRALKEGIVIEEFDHAKRRAADGLYIHAAIIVALRNIEDFCGAARAGDAVGKTKEHAEFRLVFETIADHAAIAGLKNVQGKGSAWE